MTVEDEVRAATDAFYVALERYVHGETEPMLALWWQGGPVTTGHPLHGWARGWDEVLATWSKVDILFDESDFSVEDVTIHIHGDFAYMIGVERIMLEAKGLRTIWFSPVTNIFRRVEGAWRIIHHHVDSSKELQQMAIEVNNVR